MANEFTLSGSISYEDSEMDDPEVASISELIASISTKRFTHAKQSVGTSEEAINLGEVGAPGWFFAVNRDETNYIELKVATGASIFAKLKAGEFCLVRLGSAAQAPFAVANTAACQLEYWVWDT